jgi:phosphopantothenoylcysteine decarboxylase / phosphopantothenate---cysteine ligase
VIDLVTNPDIAAELGAAKQPGQVLVAFAAETAEMDEALANGQAKLLRKRADLVVVNQVGIGKTFGSERNAAVILSADGARTVFPEAAKDDLADRIWDLVVSRLTLEQS